MTSAAASSRVSAWAPLARATFRALWIAQLTSNIGSWMQTVGAQWFLVQESHSPALVAWIQTANALPVLLFSLFAGVLADAFNRKRLLLLTTALSTVVAIVLTVLTYTGGLEPWSLLLLTFLIGCSGAFTAPAWQAIQPELVPREELTAAASLGSVTVNGARAIGPAIAGVLVALTGPGLVFALNALSFLGVIGALAMWKRPVQSVRSRERLGAALSAGLRYVRFAPIVQRILLRAGLFGLPASAYWALLPAEANDRLKVGAGGYGVLLGMVGAGAVLGVVLMPWLKKVASNNALLAWSAFVFALATVSIAICSYPVVLIVSIPAGVAWMASLTTLNASAQLSLAPWVRARGMSFYLLVFMGSQAVGSFIWGALSAPLGVTATLIAAAALMVLVGASVAVLPLRRETGLLDRSILPLCTGTPTLIFDPEPEDGPVTVTVTYHVTEEKSAEFLQHMRLLEKSRSRTGASYWRLDRSGEEPDVYREEFVVRSWGEFQRQHDERWTGSDDNEYRQALAATDAEPHIAYFFAVR